MFRVPCRGFSLTEIMIVVLILGLLAAIAIPHFSSATENSRDTSAKTTLQYLRGQVELFKSQHGEMPPQLTGLWTIMQTFSASTETNTPNPTGTGFGPYFRRTPVNPWNGLTTVSSAPVDANAGWYYTATPTSYELRIRTLDGSVDYNY
jgi:type II secretion system protein G